MREIRVSASRIKALKECTLAFWYKEVLGLPETSHWKTRVGTIVHLLFECLTHPRRRKLLQEALTSDIWRAADRRELERFIRWQLARHEVTRSSVDEISELLRVALLGIKPYFVNDKGEWTPPPRILREHEFKFKVGRATLKGYIDLLLVWDDRAVIIDLKTQAKKWAKDEVPSNVQAIIYQLATYRTFGFLAPVEFVMVRHAPSKRYPRNHIQRVEAPDPLALSGLELYVEHMFGVFNEFSFQDACVHPHDDEGFCLRVCQFRVPFDYWVVLDKDGDVQSSHFTLDNARLACQDGGTIEERHHGGCYLRYRP